MSPNRWYNGNNKNHMETAEMERIMKTTIIGFPRVGSLRELKFAARSISEMRSQHRNWADRTAAACCPLELAERSRNRTDSGKRFLFL